MNQILTLWLARTREYYRDQGSLFWSFVATPFMVIVLAIAFAGDDREILRAGVLEDGNQKAEEIPFADQKAIALITYSDQQQAIDRVRFHQLDILLNPTDPQRYWVNPDSSKGRLLESLLLAEYPNNWQKTEISGRRVRYIDWVLPGILAMNMMFSGLWGIGYVIVRYRKNGVLKRLQATPVKAWQFLLSQALSRLTIMLTVTTLVFIGCNLFIDFMMLGSYWLLLLIAIVGNLAIIGISLLMAARTASEELANGLLNLISFPMLLLSELWFSLDASPDWLVSISNWLPLTHIVKAARAVMLEGAGLSEISLHLIVLALMAAVFITFAAKLFRWHKP